MEFKLPDIGEGIAEGEIVQWLVKTGDHIIEDQPMVEVMTDKATVEIPSPASGIVKEIKVKDGELVPVGTVIMVFELEGSFSKPSKTETKTEASKGFVLVNENIKSENSTQKILATPAVRKYAREKHIDISNIKGSGRNGRVTREDIDNYHHNQSQLELVQQESKELVLAENIRSYSSYTENTKTGNEERVPFRGIRKKIAENLIRSKHHAPHFMIADEVDMTELVNFRNDSKDLASKKGVKLTYLPFIIKAVTSALKDFPVLNSALDEEKNELILKKYYNIGVAVSTSHGLVVPVIKNADQKSIFTLAHEITALAQQTRDGKVTVDHLKGGTFTITNIGSIGGTLSAPIINYPEVAILGINKIVKKPVVRNDEIVIRQMMNVSMSCDHRVVDGSVAAFFLNNLIELLENPKLLLLE